MTVKGIHTYEYRAKSGGVRFAITDDLNILSSFMELQNGYVIEIPFYKSLEYKKHVFVSEMVEHNRTYGVFGY